jgi:two-component system, chemotaxis family, protein-glutamate methylesterase/glutaminase
MRGHDIVVVGASAGGVEALGRLARGLPEDLPAALFVVLHVPSSTSSALPSILDRQGPLPATHASDGEPIRHGRIYVAPPDSHMLVGRDTIRLGRGPRENGHRPAVDPMFRSAARVHGLRTVGVVLSGVLDDGAAGLLAIKALGGITIVQDPDDALYPSMPNNAIEHVEVDHIAPVPAIAKILGELAMEPPVPGPDPPPHVRLLESEPDEFVDPTRDHGPGDVPGRPSIFACPDCQGVLWEIQEGGLVRYRCHVGHAWSPESLLSEQGEALENALWVALRSLQERAALARRMADPARERGHRLTAARFDEQAREAEEAAAVLRQLLVKRSSVATVQPRRTEDEGTSHERLQR